MLRTQDADYTSPHIQYSSVSSQNSLTLLSLTLSSLSKQIFLGVYFLSEGKHVWEDPDGWEGSGRGM